MLKLVFIFAKNVTRLLKCVTHARTRARTHARAHAALTALFMGNRINKNERELTLSGKVSCHFANNFSEGKKKKPQKCFLFLKINPLLKIEQLYLTVLTVPKI